jgi:hypothetical protein
MRAVYFVALLALCAFALADTSFDGSGLEQAAGNGTATGNTTATVASSTTKVANATNSTSSSPKVSDKTINKIVGGIVGGLFGLIFLGIVACTVLGSKKKASGGQGATV